MKWANKKMIQVSFILLILMQLYQPARNTDNGQVLPIHFTKTYQVPQNIESVLQNSCYDCHSNNTNYLWFDYIQPLRMMVEIHIKKGKENLNFSEWGNYSKRKQHNKLDRIIKQLKENEMPLASYTLIHSKAKLTERQKHDLTIWILKTIERTNQAQ